MTEAKRPLKVFLSYASQDKPVVHDLSRRLSDERWIETWLDVKRLLPGQDWRIKIEEAVEDSDIVIICLSSNSVTKEGYVQKELRYAREIALEKPEEAIFLVPLRLDECEVPRGLRFLQWVDYFGERKDESYTALIESLKLRHEQKLKLEEIERARKEKLDHELAERTVREKAEREAIEKAAREMVEQEAAEKARLEAEEQLKQKVAREKAEREEVERKAKEKDAREKAEKESVEKARLETQELERQKAIREKLEREKAEKDAVQKAWFDKTWSEAEERARQKAEKEKADQEEVEKIPREKSEGKKKEREFVERPENRVEKSTPIEEPARRSTQVEPKPLKARTVQRNTGAQITIGVVGFAIVALVIGVLGSNNGDIPTTSIPTSTSTTQIQPLDLPTKTQKPEPTPTETSNQSSVSSLQADIPDGLSGRLVFTLYGDIYNLSSGDIYSMNLDTGKIEVIYQNGSSVFDVDRDTFGFNANEEMILYDILTNEITAILKPDSSIVLDYSHLNEKAILNWAGLQVASLEGGELINPINVIPNLNDMDCPQWHPSRAGRLLYEAYAPGGSSYGSVVNMIDAVPGSEPIRLAWGIDNAGRVSCASWSPDGKSIAFGNSSNYSAWGEPGIHIVNYISGGKTKITSTRGYHPVWSPDGNFIAFLTDQGISIISIDGSNEQLVLNERCGSLIWMP
jgi:hypothetical protein